MAMIFCHLLEILPSLDIPEGTEMILSTVSDNQTLLRLKLHTHFCILYGDGSNYIIGHLSLQLQPRIELLK